MMLTKGMYRLALALYLLAISAFWSEQPALALCDSGGCWDLCENVNLPYIGCADPSSCSGCACEGAFFPGGCS